MAEGIALPQLTVEEARAAQEVLLEQERVLRYERFGAAEALELGRIAASLAPGFGEGISVTITRESDGVRMFQWVADDKDERNLLFAEGKRVSARKAGHAGPWAQLEAAIAGDVSHVWDDVPAEVPACGAFPIRVGDKWVATIAVSGYMEGLDHEIILRALEQNLGRLLLSRRRELRGRRHGVAGAVTSENASSRAYTYQSFARDSYCMGVPLQKGRKV